MSSDSNKNIKRKQQAGSASGDASLSNSFELFSLDSLDTKERSSVESFVSSVTNNAGIIGVGKGFSDWDLRPVIALKNENEPSVLRLLGKGVAGDKEVTATVKRTFEALQKHGSLNADFREWGEYQGQIWFRRGLHKDTLYSRMSGEIDLSIEQGVSIIRSLLEEVCLWHERGVIHGHIANSNILVTPAYGVALLDAAAGAALLCSAENAKAMRYRLAAPEIVDRGALSDKADLFGTGEVIRRVIASLKKRYRDDPSKSERIEALRNFSNLAGELGHKDPFKRLAIDKALKRAEQISLPIPSPEVPDDSRPEAELPKSPKREVFEAVKPKGDQKIEAAKPRKEAPKAEKPKNLLQAKVAPKAAPKVAPSPEIQQTEKAESQTVEKVNEKEEAPKAATSASPKIIAPKKVEPKASKDIEEDPFSFEALFGDDAAPASEEPFSLDSFMADSTPIEVAKSDESRAPVFKEEKKTAPEDDPFSVDSLLADLDISSPEEEISVAQIEDPLTKVAEFPASEASDDSLGFDPFTGAFDEFEKSIESSKDEKSPEDTFDPFAGAFLDDDDILDPEALSEPDTSVKAKKKKATKSSNSFEFYLIIVGCLLVGIWYFFSGVGTNETLEYSVQDIRSAWDSKIPSRMLTVAELATDREVDSKLVQDIIVSSAKNGKQLPKVIKVPLLRVAFNDRWEMELDAEDRRFAIALGLAGLMRDKLPKDLGSITERHPGVILAVTASAGKSTRRILEQIPALSLANLPPPFGPAFQKLTEGDEDLTCASDAVHLLARFGTRGLEGIPSQEIVDYLTKDTSKRMKALALIVSYDELPAKRVLDILIKDPNVNFSSPEVAWAKVWEVASWPGMDSADKLFSVAGIPPASRVSVDQLRTFFSHPDASMRSYAVREAKQRLQFEHPAANAILSAVEKNPEMMTAEQLLRLGEILQSPSKVSDDRVKSWLESEPSVEVVSSLLMSRSNMKESDKTDTWFAYYLKNAEWKPNMNQLKKLITHPDKYTRLFAYTEIQDRVTNEKIASEAALELFRAALSNESDPEYQEQLQMMIEQF